MRTLCIATALLAASCHPDDIDPMERQPRLVPYGTSDVFSDGQAMRAPPAGAIPRERDLDEAAPDTDPALLALGRARFDVVCAPCHGLVGDGKSLVASKMELRPPPSLHDPRLRALEATALYRVIRDGYGLMPGYATHLSTRERWAVVAYTRALQLSQSLPIADAPDSIRRRLEETP